MAYQRRFDRRTRSRRSSGIEWTAYYDYRDKQGRQRLFEVRIRHKAGQYRWDDIWELSDMIMIDQGFQDLQGWDKRVIGVRGVEDVHREGGAWRLIDKIGRTVYPYGDWGSVARYDRRRYGYD